MQEESNTDLIIEVLCDILFDTGTVASTGPILPKPLPKPLRIICCVPASLAFAVIIAIMAIVAVNCIQDMPVVSILLGALDVIMIFLLLSIISRAFGTGKCKK